MFLLFVPWRHKILKDPERWLCLLNPQFSSRLVPTILRPKLHRSISLRCSSVQTDWLSQKVNQHKNRKNIGFNSVNNELITHRIFVKTLYGSLWSNTCPAKMLKENGSPSPWSGAEDLLAQNVAARHARCLPLAGSTTRRTTYNVAPLAVTAKQHVLLLRIIHATQGENVPKKQCNTTEGFLREHAFDSSIGDQ